MIASSFLVNRAYASDSFFSVTRIVTAGSNDPVDLLRVRRAEDRFAVVREDQRPDRIEKSVTRVVGSSRDWKLAIHVVLELSLTTWFNAVVSLVVESPVFADTVIPILLLELEVVEEEVLLGLELAHLPDAFALALNEKSLRRWDR
jgi:hypothetical protein